MPPELEKAIIATLIKEFHLTLEQIGELTDRQIVEYYFHKRDRETGAILIPENVWEIEATKEKPTLEGELLSLQKLALVLKLKPENVAECERKLREKFSKVK